MPIKLAYDLRCPEPRMASSIREPAPLTDYRPVCQQSWSQGLLLYRSRRFFPRGARSHSQYALLPTHGGMAQAESTWVPGSVPRWFTRVKMVTHPDTNQARRRVTALIKSNTLLLHCSSIILTHVLVSAPLKSIDYNVAMTFILNNNNNDNNHTDGILCVKCR